MFVPNVGRFQYLLCRFGLHRRGRLRPPAPDYQRARCSGCERKMIRKPGEAWRLADPDSHSPAPKTEPDAAPEPQPAVPQTLELPKWVAEIAPLATRDIPPPAPSRKSLRAFVAPARREEPAEQAKPKAAATAKKAPTANPAETTKPTKAAETPKASEAAKQKKAATPAKAARPKRAKPVRPAKTASPE